LTIVVQLLGANLFLCARVLVACAGVFDGVLANPVAAQNDGLHAVAGGNPVVVARSALRDTQAVAPAKTYVGIPLRAAIRLPVDNQRAVAGV
jgi:hypothetical protein